MSEELINQTVFAELQTTTGPDFTAELIETFLEEAPGMIAELRSARADGDNERFQRAAHSLKTNANTFGAVRLAAKARELELGGLNADPDQDQATLVELERAHAETAAALKVLSNA